MHSSEPSPAPNFTTAVVVMFGVNITWIFMAVWAIWGLVFVMGLGWVINHMMTRIDAWARARNEDQIRNPKARVKS